MPTKLRGGSDSELTRFKRLWPSLSDSAQEFWREQFVSELTRPQIRAVLKSRLKVNLQWDRQLTEFRSWLDRQDKLDAEASAVQQDEEELKRQFGSEWSLDQIREEVLKRSYARSIASGDFSSARKTIVQDLNVRKVQLDERRVALLEKKAAAYDRAQEILNQAKSSKGGVTPETVRQIERELKLLP